MSQPTTETSTTHQMNDWWLAQDPEKARAFLDKVRGTAAHTEWMIGNHNEWFAAWMLLLDRRLERAIGISSRDLADFPSYDTYESGVSPAAGAAVCLEEQDMDFSDVLG